MIELIISGGQTGADRGGLEAAEMLHIKTGGTAPKGWRTLDGPNPELGTRFGLVEDPSPNYPPRTAKNARNSDGTIRFAMNFASPGELCTLRYIKMYNKPHININIRSPIHPQLVRDWIVAENIRTLNVAGNSERTAPGIKKFVIEYLMKVLE